MGGNQAANEVNELYPLLTGGTSSFEKRLGRVMNKERGV